MDCCFHTAFLKGSVLWILRKSRSLWGLDSWLGYSLKGMDEKMDVDMIFKIAAIGIIVAVLNQVLIRSGREEQAMMTTLAGLIVVLMMIINEISVLFETVKSVFGL